MNLLDNTQYVTEEMANTYLMYNAKYYDASALPYIKQELMKMTTSQFQALQMTERKDPIILLVVSILVGSLGIDRILLGQVGLGVVKLITCGGMGIWTIIDWIIIMNETRKVNLDSFRKMVYNN